jgi:hypothetical protein
MSKRMATTKGLFAVAAAAGAFAGAAAAGDYHGQVRALMPTPKEVGFTQLIEFRQAKKPAADLAHGFEGGVAAIYAKGTAKSPVEAAATVYVYATDAEAKSAWQRACPSCSHVLVKGVQMRYEERKVNGAITFRSVTFCRNIWAAVIAAGPEAATKLANDVGVISGAVYRRAAHFGMSACK